MSISGGQSGLAGPEEGYHWSSQDINLGMSIDGHLVSKAPEIARLCFPGS